MRIKKQDFRGTGKVFSFTLIQVLKNKANLVPLVIMFLLAAAILPISVLTGGGNMMEVDFGASEIETVYIADESGYSLVMEPDEYFADTVFQQTEMTSDAALEVMGDRDAYVSLVKDEEGDIVMEIFTSGDSTIGSEDLYGLQDYVDSMLIQAKCLTSGISDGQMDIVTSPYESTVMTESGYKDSTGNSFELEYFVQFGYSIIVMMMSMFAITYIIRSVVEEKSSRLVEFLMVSVRPLALVTGKILASMVYVCILFGVMIVGFFLSLAGTGFFVTLSMQDLLGMVAGMEISTAEISISLASLPLDILIVLISLILGYMTFSILAGLAGASCSTAEDIQSATSVPTLVIMACYIVACMISAFDSSTVCVVVSLLPFISIFCAPAQFLLGNIPFWMLALSWVLQLAVFAVLAVFAASVYESLLMHRGSRVKLGDMIGLAAKRPGKEHG